MTRNKFGAKKTWSNLINRQFDSKLEADRAEQLYIASLEGSITDLQFQKKFILSDKPKVSIIVDFAYKENGNQLYEDAKGVLMPDFRVKMAWFKAKYNHEIILYKGNRR